jgi:hypothetical protein
MFSTAVDVLDSLLHALAEVAILLAVAKLDGFVFTGGGPARHGGTTEAAVRVDFRFHRGISARIQDLARADVDNF